MFHQPIAEKLFFSSYFHLLWSLLFCIGLNGQRVLLNDPGRTYNDTDGPTLDVYGPVNVSTCSSVRFELDFDWAIPWEGPGNLESSDECNFGNPPCAGNPRNPLGPCANCWDFLWAQFNIDGAEIGGDLIGEAGTTNAEQRGRITLDHCTLGNAATASINVTTQTWAGNETVTFSGIMIICFEGIPTALANPNPICEGEVLNLNGSVGDINVVSNLEWTGPGDIDDPFSLNTRVENIPPGPAIYTLTSTDINGCVTSSQVTVTVNAKPMAFQAGPITECSTTGQASFDLTSLNATISGGSGDPVLWFRDAGLNSQINTPQAFLTGSTTVYVVVDNGFCESEVIEVMLIVERTPSATRAMMEMCEEITGSGRATFDLTEIEDMVLGGQSGMTVVFTSDPGGLVPVPNPFNTGTTVIYAKVVNGMCESLPVEINLFVYPLPQGNSITIQICEDPPGSGFGMVDLYSYADSILTDNGHSLSFFVDDLLSIEASNPFMATIGTTQLYAKISDGRCDSEPILIQIEVLTSPDINGANFSICEDPPGSGQATFNLDSIINQLIGNQMNVTVNWYADSSGNVSFPTNYSGGDTTIYAQASNGPCSSNIEEIQLKIIPPPEALSITDTLCGDSNMVARFDLLQYINEVASKPNSQNVVFSADISFDSLIGEIVVTGRDTVFAKVLEGICESELAILDLVVIVGPTFNLTDTLLGCDSLILPGIQGDNLSGNEQWNSQSNGMGISYAPGTVFYTSATVYTLDQTNLCSAIDSTQILIYPAADAGDTNRISVCEGANVNLVNALINADLGGTWRDIDGSGSLGGSIFNSTGKAGNTYRFSYSLVADLPCPMDSTVITVDVVNEVTAGRDTIIEVCLGDTIFLQSQLLEADFGGLFSESMPSGGLVGDEFIASLSGTGQFIITYTVGDGIICPESTSQITVNVINGVAIDPVEDTTVCGYYVLPAISGANVMNAAYYNASGGNGDVLSIGDTIFTDTTLYIFGTIGSCGDEQAFEVMINQPAFFNLSGTYCADTTFNINGEIFDLVRPSGMVTIRSGALNGCDSIISIDLDFYPESTRVLDTTLCKGEFILVNGQRYDENRSMGMETIMNGSINGCDSIVMINLNFRSSEAQIDTAICENSSIFIGGEVFDSSRTSDMIVIPNGGMDGCDSTIQVNIQLLKPTSNTINRTFCFGDSIIVNGVRYDENRSSGIETIIGGNQVGCDSIITVNLTFQSSSDTLIQANICEGDTVIVNGVEYFQGKESGRDTIIGGSISTGCDSVIIVSILIDPTSNFILLDTLCPQDEVSILNQVFNINNPTGQISIPGGASNGCDSIVDVRLNFKNFSLSPDFQEFDILLGDSVSIQFITDLDYTSIVWDITEGVSCLDCLNPILKPSQTTTYNVTFVDENGCTLSARIVINVSVITNVYIPNTFSPNGDNLNDRIKIYAKNGVVRNINSFQIFDRWGELVYQEMNTSIDDGTHIGWDGIFNGKKCVPDVFVYRLDLTLNTGENQNISGSITLVQ